MGTSEFEVLWKQYEPLLEAIVELLHPFAEAAVHDLKRGKVVAIYHNISKRKVGDPSPLHELKIKLEKFPPHFSPYYKSNWDGRPLKCTSITLRDSKNMPIGLICINIDVSSFQQGHKILSRFLGITEDADNPIEIFGESYESQIHTMMDQYLDEKKLAVADLNREQKRELVQSLYEKGVFNFKNAAPFLAKTLKTSRATIYNYVKLGME